MNAPFASASSRRSSAGAVPAAAWSPRSTSFPSPRKPASSSRSATGSCVRPCMVAATWPGGYRRRHQRLRPANSKPAISAIRSKARSPPPAFPATGSRSKSPKASSCHDDKAVGKNPRLPARPRRPPRARRFRHRLRLPQPAQPLPLRQNQDRPLLHQRPRRLGRTQRYRPLHRRPRHEPRHPHHRRRRRNPRPTRPHPRRPAAPASRATISANPSPKTP